MNEIAKVISGCFLVVALASPALAHHSAAAYDTQKEVRLTGTITQYRFGNPHVYMILQVKKADGSTKPVEVEAGAASVLNPLGFKKDSLAAGDVVSRCRYHHRSTRARGYEGGLDGVGTHDLPGRP